MEGVKEIVWLVCVRRALRKEFGRDPSPGELAQRLRTPPEELEKSLDTIAHLKSIGLDFDRLDDAELTGLLEGNDPVKPVPETLTPSQEKRVRESLGLGSGPYADLTLEELERQVSENDARFREDFRKILRKRGISDDPDE
jgi:DNA-directed RNA polymerase sigma subunit (sigma70/sigma32)